MREIDVRRLTPDKWRVERHLRLAALTEAPSAFGSTLADARLLDETGWRARMAGQIRFAAFLDGTPLGTAGWAHARPPYPDGEALLLEMWVAPAARGAGVGDALVRAIVADVTESGIGTIRLSVTPGNAPAVRLYARNGFVEVPTPDRVEPGMIEMIRPVGSG
ncbi:MAG TPA: GNAT family N-acetyltransferase [Thermomicrobiales bacterium]|jgi:ribosomal protein S18 acetylase RimI-like enzyme|nr:GNAT family N-acetyltransferase [Thermomicrobiales bacterium]